ncbi:MAG: GNAT family N-acetyltransferase [Theionarchaea archaeon]|nr:GNAT family N-acetyltransferase [Theionarchaea archaeon]
MTYSITHYQDGFIDDQERVGKEVTRTWTFFFQTPAEQLYQLYSQPDFDRETRHYCFKDNELVGFLTSKVGKDDTSKASLEFPLVLPGHEPCESLLFERALEVLRRKGVRIVSTRVSDQWGKTLEMAEKWGYSFSEVVSVVYGMDVDTASIEDLPDSEDIVPYDHEKDFDQMVDIFVNNFNMTLEEARANFESLEKSGDQVIAHLVIREDGKIVARALVLRSEDDPAQARTGAFYVTEENQRKQLLLKLIKICKEAGISMLATSLFGDQISQKDRFVPLYESLGFTHRCTVSSYVKHI